MIGTKKASKKLKSLTDDDIMQWLAANPEFLQRNPQAWASQKVEHESGGASSLIERQVCILRAQNKQLRERFDQLVENARLNEKRVFVLNRLAAALLAARSLNEVVGNLAEQLDEQMAVDNLRIGIKHSSWNGQQDCPHILVMRDKDERSKAAINVFRFNEPQCGAFSPEQLSAWFGDQAEPLACAAMLPLGERKTSGVLVLASKNPAIFTEDMGTLFLGLLSDLVTAVLQRYLGATILV